MQTIAFLPNLGWPEMLVIGIVMLILFGRRLPEVGRSLGQGIVSFKQGLKDVETDMNDQNSAQSNAEPPKFDSVKAAQHPERDDVAHSAVNSEHAAAKPSDAG